MRRHCLHLGPLWHGLAAAGLCLGLLGSARADRLPLPPDTPAAYRAECGSCHLAYPPGLLASNDWKQLLARLEHHFASDARIETPALREILAFLTRHGAADGPRSAGGIPPRISRTAYFERKHRKVPAGLWQDPRVASPANCEACHRGAADGRYSEHDLALPELRRR
ncbi:cytochrome C [Dechloromonas sp. ZY10]|uniref:cytochrome C n=1 Tax=Dechloromonas aquae TaxID=2664436 RepID=UPI003529817D